MRRLSLMAVLVIVGAIGVSADTYPRQPGVAIDRYAFAITFSDTNNDIQMAETVDLRATAAGLSAVDFDLCGVGPRTPGPVADPCVGSRRGGGGASPGGGGLSGSANESATATGMTVTAVTSDGKPLQFTHKNDRLRVMLAQSLVPGDGSRSRSRITACRRRACRSATTSTATANSSATTGRISRTTGSRSSIIRR